MSVCVCDTVSVFFSDDKFSRRWKRVKQFYTLILFFFSSFTSHDKQFRVAHTFCIKKEKKEHVFISMAINMNRSMRWKRIKDIFTKWNSIMANPSNYLSDRKKNWLMDRFRVRRVKGHQSAHRSVCTCMDVITLKTDAIY